MSYEDLDKWWNTEPFGFDHPDTYEGIKKLLEKREKIIKRLQRKIDNLELDSDAIKSIGKEK